MDDEDLRIELAEDRELERLQDEALQADLDEDVLLDQRPRPFADDEVAFGFADE